MPVAKIPGRVTATHVAEFNSAADRIHLEQLEVELRIGVTDEERANPQRIVINLTIWPSVAFEQLHDDIARTLNYVDLCRAARDFVQGREWKLIETLASDLGSELLGRFSLAAVEIEVRKFVLPNTAFVSATTRKINR